MTPKQQAEIAAFVRERNEMLLACDVDRMIEFAKKNSPDSPPFTNRLVAEMALHKARTAAKGLPIDARRSSRDWLLARGYSSLDDGDLG